MGLASFCKVCVDGVDSLVEHKFVVKKYTEVVLVANKMAGAEVNSKYCI
jgi:ketol-acid reductoisomerase